MITADLLVAAVGCSRADGARWAPFLLQACAAHYITTPARVAAFLAQIGHESGSLHYVREVADGSAYEGRVDLGNTQPGDGTRYRGRGLIQITGRANYRATTKRLQWANPPDFEAQPEKLEEPFWAAYSAADWWQANTLSTLADRGEFIAIGRQINRGNRYSDRPANGEADRLARWERAKAAVAALAGAGAPIAPAPIPTQPVEPAAPPAAPIPAVKDSLTAPTVRESRTVQPEKPMLPALLVGLATSLIDAFSPLAREKVRKELARHGASPEVADQVYTAVIETAKTATGKADPIAATAEATATPDVLVKVEDSAVATLDKMAPVLDKLAQWDQGTWNAEEASRSAAAARAQHEGSDFGPLIAKAAVFGLYAMIVVLAIVVILQVCLVDDHKPSGEVLALLGSLMTLAAAKSNTVYDYRFGTSRSSSAKDVVIGELSRRKP